MGNIWPSAPTLPEFVMPGTYGWRGRLHTSSEGLRRMWRDTLDAQPGVEWHTHKDKDMFTLESHNKSQMLSFASHVQTDLVSKRHWLVVRCFGSDRDRGLAWLLYIEPLLHPFVDNVLPDKPLAGAWGTHTVEDRGVELGPETNEYALATTLLQRVVQSSNEQEVNAGIRLLLDVPCSAWKSHPDLARTIDYILKRYRGIESMRLLSVLLARCELDTPSLDRCLIYVGQTVLNRPISMHTDTETWSPKINVFTAERLLRVLSVHHKLKHVQTEAWHRFGRVSGLQRFAVLFAAEKASHINK